MSHGTRLSGQQCGGGEGLCGAGNVWEWVADWSAAYSSTAVAHDTGGIGPATGEARAARGGGFSSPANEQRASTRGAGGPVAPIYFVGFRCTKPVP